MLLSTTADFIVYCDSGSIINLGLTEVIGSLQATGAAVLAFQLRSAWENPRNEYVWTKGQVLRALDAMALGIADTDQIAATASVWRVCEESRKLAAEWLQLMQDPVFATDLPSNDAEELKFFVKHRHDQSVFSLLIKKLLLRNTTGSMVAVTGDFGVWVGHHQISRAIKFAHRAQRRDGVSGGEFMAGGAR